jgi:hypothetical protein
MAGKIRANVARTKRKGKKNPKNKSKNYNDGVKAYYEDTPTKHNLK